METGVLQDRMPACKNAPHLYLVWGEPPEAKLVHFSAQHCCEDHGAAACNGWVAFDIRRWRRMEEWTH